MVRLIIVCEGETEQQFCYSLLIPHLVNKGVMASCPTIKKTNGGICAWSSLKKQILGHLHERAYVTTFLDFYGINDNLNFPNWEDSKSVSDKNERIDYLEKAMRDDIGNQMFVPYLQLHEFESLLFCNVEAFDNVIPKDDFLDRKSLLKILHDYQNPELINDNVATSPSHRLQGIIAGYEKPLYGTLLAQETGLKTIREKCPHFNQWISRLEKLTTNY